ncbi:hypothetical protein [Streptomyces sp. NPDC048521]|uniref:hypothetical protein n=1 Tax=Streptomyces sp. NPDC048521 TaxID=3365566 RepID=UPI0037144B24
MSSRLAQRAVGPGYSIEHEFGWLHFDGFAFNTQLLYPPLDDADALLAQADYRLAPNGEIVWQGRAGQGRAGQGGVGSSAVLGRQGPRAAPSRIARPPWTRWMSQVAEWEPITDPEPAA